MNNEIRWAISDDANELGIIHVESWRRAYMGIVPDEVLDNLDPIKRAERFKYSLEQGNDHTGVILIDDNLTGFINFGSCRDDDYSRDTGEVYGMYLHPDKWRRGLGRKLMAWGLEELKKKGYSRVILWVLEESKGPRTFYEKMGFKVEGKVEQIEIGKALNKVRYIKDLL